MKHFYTSMIFVFSLLFSVNIQAQQNIQTPNDFFGFQPGADRQLFTYEKLIDYFKILDKNSPRLKLVQIGVSPMGRPMYMALISNAKNIANLDKLKKINKELAINPNLSESRKAEMVHDGKVFIYATLSMHANEVGPSQSSPLIAYELITSKDPEVRSWLDKTVYMMVPSHNPDGMDMVVNNYLKYRGTEYEGANLPGVYHKYVGHDNNRDFVTLSQSDTKAIAGVSDTAWYPQVMFEKHQMGLSGVRYFVPPPTDAIAQVIDANLWNWMKIFGSNMITEMTADSLKGVVQQYIFDDYWPGSTETSLWKNVISMLTECASAKGATPVYVEPNELNADGKGLSDYKKSINMPDPWPGGWWRLGDIVQYEISSTKAIIKTAYLHKDEILRFRNDLCVKEVNKGKNQAPYFYILPEKQHDQSELADLIRIMQEQGVTVYHLTHDITLNNYDYHKGDVVIPMAQAYRPFIKEVMEAQQYPVRRFTTGGEVIRPYDITSWSLPLHKGLESKAIDVFSKTINDNITQLPLNFNFMKPVSEKGWGLAFSVNDNESFKTAFALLSEKETVYRTSEDFSVNGTRVPKGSFLVQNSAALKKIVSSLTTTPLALESKPAVKMQEVKLPRIALLETWFHDMDAGWTRFVFDTYHIPFTVLHPEDIAKADLSNYDYLIFPDQSKSVIMDGKYSESGYFQPNYPPEYTKGIGKSGLQKIMEYVNGGGKVLSWGRSTNLFLGTLTVQPKKGEKENFVLPYRNLGPRMAKEGLYCPGTLIKVNWKSSHALTLGMEPSTGIFYRGNPVFQTLIPGFDMDRRVIGTFPEDHLIMSGYAENIKLIGNKVAMVWLSKGKGQMVLYGFSPIFRASSPVTYKLVFNALMM
ncbi:MAG: hypothetical protein JXR71_04950 [Bacteroidales bacterium]|nr:hypothetical protein [Bacteroidales bacterium]